MRLYYFELKKIFKKRSTWITLLAALALQAFIGFSGFITDFMYGRNATQMRAGGRLIDGRILDDSLLSDLQASRQKRQELDSGYRNSKIYLHEVLPYEELYYTLAQCGINPLTTGTVKELLAARAEAMQELREAYGLSESEKSYWQEREARLPAAFTCSYASAYQTLVSMNGFYMTCMILTFFSAVCMVNVFTEEESLRTSQLLLCSRRGREPLYAAKLAAGCTVSLLAALLLAAVEMLGQFLYYGTDGFGGQFQTTISFCDSRALSIGQVMLLMLLLLLLSSLLTGLAAMLLALFLHHSVGATSTLIALLFASRLIPIPMRWRLLSQLWNLLPLNLLKIDQGFLDLRLFGAGGLRLTSYQFAPILYLLTAAGLILLGRRAYCKYK